MQPLVDEARLGRHYHKVLWSNDVFVHAESAVTLLRANDGNYDMACALDFAWYGVYDSWVIRDRLGALTSTVWPYFFEEESMRAVMNDRPAPVFSCWNGMAAIRAAPFLPPDLRRATAAETNATFGTTPLAPSLVLTHPLHTTHASTPPAEQPALSFRSSGPLECFSSECFNLPYDLRRRFDMGNVIVVPNVVTAYRWHHYVWFKWIVRHWLVRGYMRVLERGSTMIEGKSIIGPQEKVYVWDGGWCQPVSMLSNTHLKALLIGRYRELMGHGCRSVSFAAGFRVVFGSDLCHLCLLTSTMSQRRLQYYLLCLLPR